MQDITVEADERGVVRVTLNRPAVHNAFNEGMIGELTDAFADLGPALDRLVETARRKTHGAEVGLGP